MKRLTNILFFIIVSAIMIFAQTPLERGTLPTYIAPKYFGPNAFAVPEMNDGRTKKELTIELSANGDFGFAGDRTATFFGKIYIPLFTYRVNLSLWMPMYEWWENSVARQKECRLEGKPLSGNGAGDVYISTDIMAVREGRYCPSFTVRAALRTASGGDYPNARFYDSPGYFFDGTFGKSFFIKKDTDRQIEFRGAISAGFLCWQTTNARQNDAVMYGALLAIRHKYISGTLRYSGYAGWEKKGDRPMIISAQVRGYIPLKSDKIRQTIQTFAEYQYGLNDFPFHTIRIGIGYDIDILRKQKNDKQQD